MPGDRHRPGVNSGFDERDEWNAPCVVKQGDQHLKAPVQINPGLLGIRECVEVDVRNSVPRQNPLASLEMPPEIGVKQRKAHPQKRP